MPSIGLQFSVGTFAQLGRRHVPQMSHEKRAPGWLGYIRDQKLPSYMGILINHSKDPY